MNFLFSGLAIRGAVNISFLVLTIRGSARDADKSEAEKAALKAEYDRKLAEQQLKMEELRSKERHDMWVHLASFLDYQARCQRDWCDALLFQPVELIQWSDFTRFHVIIGWIFLQV